MKKKVTVAIPVFNGEKYILEALQSIAKQTITVDEVLISDNHSTDRTIDIINQFSKKHPELNLRVLRNSETVDVADNFNNCIELCSGDFLIILGADDRLKPDTVEKHLSVFKKLPDLALVGGLFDTINQDGKIIITPPNNETIIFQKGDILSYMKVTGFYMQHATIMYNMKCTRNVGYYISRTIAPDERYNVEHLVRYPIAQIREGIIESRVHEGQVTNFERLRFKEKTFHFQDNLDMAKYESTPERRKELEKLLKNWIASQSINISRVIWNNYGEKIIAMKYWFYGLKKNPNYYFNNYIFRKLKIAVKRITN